MLVFVDKTSVDEFVHIEKLKPGQLFVTSDNQYGMRLNDAYAVFRAGKDVYGYAGVRMDSDNRIENTGKLPALRVKLLPVGASITLTQEKL